MPYYNGTGPAGRGAGTGWGLGPCGAGLKRGRLGRGWGLGLRRLKFTNKEELQILEEEENALKEELEVVRKERETLKVKK